MSSNEIGVRSFFGLSIIRFAVFVRKCFQQRPTDECDILIAVFWTKIALSYRRRRISEGEGRESYARAVSPLAG